VVEIGLVVGGIKRRWDYHWGIVCGRVGDWWLMGDTEGTGLTD
jgi:hypothetical protein